MAESLNKSLDELTAEDIALFLGVENLSPEQLEAFLAHMGEDYEDLGPPSEALQELMGMEETIIDQLSDLSVEDLLTLDSLLDAEINELLGTDLSAEAIDIILDTIDERTQNALEDYLDLQAIRDDLAMLLSDISFSDFEAELAMREDFMTGKTLRDRFGRFVRSEQYVLNNSDINQIQIVSVTARLGSSGKDAGVTATSVKFNFDDLSGVSNIRTGLPWKDILGVGQLGQRMLVTNGIEYSDFGDPGAVALSSVKLEMFNPLGDNIAIKDVYQGVTNPGTFVQEIDMGSSSQKVNGVQIDSPSNREFKAQKTADQNGWLWWMGYDTGGGGFSPLDSGDKYIQFQFYWINDQGDIQDVQTVFDGINPAIMSGDGPIQNIQDILNPESGFNLQFRVTSTEFPNNEHIDAVFDPALITPYVK
ncbi:hypothetical protein IID04_05570 [PVC group bacterium]|nr:hypothetical protein [PVC group bacterium]